MMVFALGGEADADDAAESRYYTVRRMLTRIIGQAADNPNIQMAANKMAPATVRLIALVADRYGIQVTEKVAALAIPGLGAAGGALVNALFIEHFQDVARGHFIVRRLERRYGVDTVRAAYLALGGD